MIFKVLLAINLLLILASLASGLVFLTKDDSSKKRAITSLTVRVVLSISLVILLVVGYFFGAITPNVI